MRGSSIDRNEWDDRYSAAELLWTAEANQFLVAEASELTAGRALDVACGEGRNSVWLAERGWDVTAVDFSTVALGKAARLARARTVTITLVEADVTAYVPPRQAFALVVVAYLHLPQPTRSTVLATMSEAVAPGGTMLVIGHDRSNIEAGYGGPQDSSVLATPDEIARLLVGLTVERAERVERPVDTDDGTRTAIDQLVRATAGSAARA